MTATTTGPRRQDELAGPRGSGRPHTSTSRERHQAHHPGAGGLSPEARRALLEARDAAARARALARYLTLRQAAQERVGAAHGAWQERLATMSSSALAELESAVRFGEGLGYREGWDQAAQDLWPLALEAGQARGRYLEAAAADDADRRWRAQVGRDVAASAARPSYAELCERRGEPERAERARRLLAERGIA